MSLPNELSCGILDIGLRASVTPATLWASVTLVPVQTMSMGQTEPDITLMSLVLYGEIVTHIVILFSSHTLTQVNSLQLRFFRYRHARSRSRFTTLSLQDVRVVPPLVREGRRSHIRRGNTLPLPVLLLTALSLLLLEKEKENGTSVKRRRRNTLNHFRPNVIRIRRSTRGRRVLLYLLLLLLLLQFLQTLLLFREAQPGRSLELIQGLLLRLLTILIPLLGL